MSDRTFWSRPGWASACCPEGLDTELDAHCPSQTPQSGAPPSLVCVWHVPGTQPRASMGRGGGCQPRGPMGPQAFDHWKLVLSLDKGCQASPQGPPKVHWALGLSPAAGPLPVLSAPGLRVGTAAGVGEAPQGDRVALAWPLRSWGAWAGPWGGAGPCIPRTPSWVQGGRGGGRTPQTSGHASPGGSQSEALPGAAPTIVGLGHGLATPARVAGLREPHLCLGPSLVPSGSGRLLGRCSCPLDFPSAGQHPCCRPAQLLAPAPLTPSCRAPAAALRAGRGAGGTGDGLGAASAHRALRGKEGGCSSEARRPIPIILAPPPPSPCRAGHELGLKAVLGGGLPWSSL